MSSIIVSPSFIKGILQAPASKSCMQRVCAAALLKGGKTIVVNYGNSNDDKAAIEIIKQFGAKIFFENDTLIIEADVAMFNRSSIELLHINCGESGLSLRMFTMIAAMLNGTVNINGNGSLLKRPIDFFDEILPQLNVKIVSNNGKLPLVINGPLQAINISIDGSLSSQFLTGLLFVYAYKNIDAVITVSNLKSKPYIDLSLQILKDFGLNFPINKNYQEFVFTKKSISNSTIQPLNYTVEGDWSSASFLLVAAAIAGEIIIKGLSLDSSQADIAILEVLKKVGCIIEINPNEIYVNNNKVALLPFDFDATDCPDLFPPLVTLASYCKGNSIIKGVSRLQHKESNRALTLQEEFAKMGVTILLQNDEMLIIGNGNILPAKTNSHNDHRIAMACAIAALKASGNIEIENADAVEKSYPNFYKDLELLGAKISH